MEEFESIPHLYPPLERCSISLLPENQRKNRYYDCLPFDDTLVKLPSSRYINASWITLSDPHRVVATQAPLDETIDEFWELILTYRIEYIVMLTSLIENGRTKSSYYWGESKRDRYTLAPLSQNQRGGLVETTLRLSSPSQPDLLVHHLHLRSWEDGKPPQEGIETLLEMIVDILPTPFLVHCSAGVGRTGCLLALLRWRLNPSLTPYQIVTQLRKERPSMVQTPEQYAYLLERCNSKN